MFFFFFFFFFFALDRKKLGKELFSKRRIRKLFIYLMIQMNSIFLLISLLNSFRFKGSISFGVCFLFLVIFFHFIVSFASQRLLPNKSDPFSFVVVMLHALNTYSSSRLNAHLMFPLFPENRKPSIPNCFTGRKLFLKNVTLQILNVIPIS